MKLFIIEQSMDYGSYVFGVVARNEEDALTYLKDSDGYYYRRDENLYFNGEFEIGDQKKEGYVDKYGGFAE